MKKILLYGGLAASLLVSAACTATAPANTATMNANKANSNMAVVTNTNTNTIVAPTNTNSASTNSNTAGANTNSSSSTTGAAQDFMLHNQTGIVINALYISPSDAADWEEDILGKDTLASGESLDVKFKREEKAAKWDLRIEDKDGNFIVWEDLNLLEINDLTLNYKDKKATADIK